MSCFVVERLGKSKTYRRSIVRRTRRCWCVFCVMRGIQLLGPSVAISVVLISQLSFALAVDTFGWFGLPQIDLSFGQLIGLAVMVCGIFVLKRYQVVAPEEKAKDQVERVS